MLSFSFIKGEVFPGVNQDQFERLPGEEIRTFLGREVENTGCCVHESRNKYERHGEKVFKQKDT